MLSNGQIPDSKGSNFSILVRRGVAAGWWVCEVEPKHVDNNTDVTISLPTGQAGTPWSLILAIRIGQIPDPEAKVLDERSNIGRVEQIFSEFTIPFPTNSTLFRILCGLVKF